MKTQDDIFRAMSADRKVEVGTMLWLLAKELVGDKITYKPYGRNRSETFGSSNCKHSR